VILVIRGFKSHQSPGTTKRISADRAPILPRVCASLVASQ
jgi:hypothetical protein